MNRSIHEAFRRFALAAPDRIAIACGEQRLTYAELDARSDAIARGLRSRGVGAGATVGLSVPRSVDAIVAILGVLKAGAAYLPFDPTYPLNLLRYIYKDSAPTVMLCAGAAAAAPFWAGDALQMGELEASPAASAESPEPTLPDDLAYVMYTSGSTGRPKGVLIPHRGVLNLVLDNPFVRLGSGDVLLQLSPLSFDASTFEIWGALLNGGTLAILPTAQPSLEEIGQAIRRHGATTLWLTAGVFHLMVDRQLDALRPLRQLLVGGDVLSPAHVARAVRALPQTQLVNGYGPTENTTFTCCHAIVRDHSPVEPVPIGRVIAGAEAHVIDGELYVGGAGLARGYLNRAELTAERFIPHPFDRTPGARLYRTGDRARQDPDGTLHFLGRVDRQVKINGKRVELDEIEACLRRSPLVRDAAAISFEHAGQRRLAAFVTAGSLQPVPIAELRGFLREELPDYMQPATLTVLDAMPLSANGKVDRASLQLPKAVGQPMVAGDVEGALLRIWRAALGPVAIGRDDNFFDLGGTSLQMIQVHAAIQASLKADATLVDLYRHPSIGALQRWIGCAAPQDRSGAQERARKQRAAIAGITGRATEA